MLQEDFPDTENSKCGSPEAETQLGQVQKEHEDQCSGMMGQRVQRSCDHTWGSGASLWPQAMTSIPLQAACCLRLCGGGIREQQKAEHGGWSIFF